MKKYIATIPLFILFTLSPWIFNPNGKWIYELPKARIIYSGILLTILASLWLVKKLHTSKITWFILAYVLILSVTGVILSSRPDLAFWGSYTRQLGLIGYLHLFLFPFFLSELLKEIGIKTVYKLIAWGSLGTCILALSQYTYLSPFAAVESFGFRLYGSFGEPNLLGYYLVLVTFPVWQTIQEYTWRQLQKYFYLLILLTSTWTIIDSGSRGAMLALLAGLVLLSIHHSRTLLKRYKTHLLVGLTLLSIGVVAVFSWQLQDKHSFISLRILNNTTVAIRLEIWKTTFAEANKVWWKGHGLENLSPIFAYKSPELKKLLHDPNETIDRAHNDALDHYYNGGIWLLVAYLILMSSLIFYSWRLWRQKNSLVPLGIILQFLIISSVGPVHSSHILFLALAITMIHTETKQLPAQINILFRFLISLLVVILICWHVRVILGDFT